MESFELYEILQRIEYEIQLLEDQKADIIARIAEYEESE